MPSSIDLGKLRIEYETQSEDGQEVTLVRLSGSLNDHTHEAQTELVPLVEAGQRHWRFDLRDVHLKNDGACFLFCFGLFVHRKHGGSIRFSHLNQHNWAKLNCWNFALFTDLELTPLEPPGQGIQGQDMVKSRPEPVAGSDEVTSSSDLVR